MKLTRCYIENFGTIHQYMLHFEPGLTLIKENNGFGKTTLAAYIKAMFYGFPKSGKALDKNERKRYTPWQGGIYGGYIEFTYCGKEYRIERTFGHSPKDDHFKLFTLNPISASHDFTENIGYEIFKINGESFEKTFFMQQPKKYDGFSSTEINTAMVKMAKEISDLENYHDALKALKLTRNSIVSQRGSEGSLPKLNKEIMDLENKIHVLSAQKSQLIHAKNDLDETNQKLNALNETCDTRRMKNQQATIALQQQKKFKNELEQIDEILSTSADTTNKHVHKNKIKLFPSLILSLIGCVFIFFSKYENIMITPEVRTAFQFIAYILLLASVVSLSICFIFHLLRQNMRNHRTTDLNDDESYIRELSIKKSLLLSQLTNLQEEYDTYIHNDFGDTEASEIAILKEKQMLLHEQISLLKHSIESIYDFEHDLEMLIIRRNELTEKLKLLDKTIEHLTRAYSSLSSVHIDSFKGRFHHYAKQLIDSPTQNIYFDQEINPTIEISGIQREISYFSSAEQTIYSLCIRLALIDILHPNQNHFLLLDDPFLNLDEVNLSNVMAFLDRYSETHQIIYLTCHASRI